MARIGPPNGFVNAPSPKSAFPFAATGRLGRPARQSCCIIFVAEFRTESYPFRTRLGDELAENGDTDRPRLEWLKGFATIRGMTMTKKTAGAKKVQAAAKEIRHARLELPDHDYERLKRVARSNGLAVAAYIRQAVLKQVRRDEAEVVGGK